MTGKSPAKDDTAHAEVALRRLWAWLTNAGYRPECHYMRGVGTATRTECAWLLPTEPNGAPRHRAKAHDAIRPSRILSS